MRWIYFNQDAGEAAARKAVVARIDAWWRAFAAKGDDLRVLFAGKARWDLPGWMGENLDAIHPGILWEYGQAVRDGGHRLVLTPESAHELRPLVATILGRAPTLPGWEFYDARLPEDLEMTRETVRARAGREIDDLRVRVSVGAGGLVDLTYTSPQIRDVEDEAAFNAAFVATETLLGERRLDRWVGVIEIEPGEDARRHAIRLDRLKETVDAAVEGLRDQFPATPHHEWAGQAEWTLWELEPAPADDFPGKADLFVGKSANPAMWTAAHSGGSFYSERFSRCGETFAHLKVDGADGLGDSEFADKADIEDAIDQALIPQGLGCHVGGGMGLRYAYVDLALTDVPAAVAAIRGRMQAGKVPRRSWILFFDADLAGEWVGIYDDSPAPPGLD